MPRSPRRTDWTIDTLREHVQRQLDDLRGSLDERYATQQIAMQTALTAAERAVQTALLAAEKAVSKAEIAAEKRFDSVNEFRAQLSDQATTFMPRTEAEQRIANNTEKIDSLAARLNTITGRSGGTAANWAAFIGGSAVLVSIIAVVITIALHK